MRYRVMVVKTVVEHGVVEFKSESEVVRDSISSVKDAKDFLFVHMNTEIMFAKSMDIGGRLVLVGLGDDHIVTYDSRHDRFSYRRFYIEKVEACPCCHGSGIHTEVVK